MRYYACRANNWSKNDYHIGEPGFCVILMENSEVCSIKWFPDSLFHKVFGDDLNGEF